MYPAPYIRGSWTPALKFGGASVGMTYDSQEGRYIRLGNSWLFTAVILLTAKGSSTGAATLTGLPFTPDASQSTIDIPITTSTMSGLSGNQLIHLTGVSGTFYFNAIGGATITTLDETHFTNASFILINGMVLAPS